MAFPRDLILQRVHGNVDTLLGSLGGGRAAGKLLMAEINSPGASGDASPFLKVLFPEVKLAATIERSLNTAIGRGLDHMVADVARAAHGNAERGYSVRGSMPAATMVQIEGVVQAYTSGDGHTVPNTVHELGVLLPGTALPGARENVSESDDVFFVGNNGIENHVEIKTPKPNYDQGRASKRRILRIHCVRAPTRVRAFVGMPYNPNGYFGAYEWPTTKYFLDATEDLLVGERFWNYVGDAPDTYQQLLECFLDVARERRRDLLSLLSEVE